MQGGTSTPAKVDPGATPQGAPKATVGCPTFVAHPFGAAWCNLSGASSGLQSLQIIVVTVLALAGLYRLFRGRMTRRGPLFRRAKWAVVSIDTGRLTTLSLSSAGAVFTGGFSGVIHELLGGRVRRTSRHGYGLIRSTHLLQEGTHLLVGGDDGVLHGLNLQSWKPERLATFGSPIYRITQAGNEEVALALGSGEIAVCSLRKAPGELTLNVKERHRRQRHRGSAFDLMVFDGILTSVGAGGALVTESVATARKMSEVQVGSDALWSVVGAEKGSWLAGCNDGALISISDGQVAARLAVHVGGVRQLALSPRGRWCVTVGKDRCVFAVSTDLKSSVLVHRAKDYVYDVQLSPGGDVIVVCDGAGDVTRLELGRPLDDLDASTLRQRLE